VNQKQKASLAYQDENKISNLEKRLEEQEQYS
jgi:hypothetical protein